MNRALMFGLIAIVLAALVGGFMVVGGPGYARLEKQDTARANDLQTWFRYLQCREHNQVLPTSIMDVDYCPNRTVPAALNDPATGAAYSYHRQDDANFEICAIFATKAQMGKISNPYRALHFDGQVGCRRGTVINTTDS